ncbi:uncharacterized protein [Ptychodera flava]|uniref:uncharacterized protein n=1 Tax=Ptychodera flava TaxID=63121 RepID=UPI00396A9D25
MMLSTQNNSRRGSVSSQNGESNNQYSDRDCQRIAAETDAAIASVHAMGPSAFATGHLPDDKENEQKPDTDEGGAAAAISSSARTTWRNPKKVGKKDKKPKKHMGNKALIVSYNWGGPIQGGVSDSVHLLVRLLRKFGISVYCTTLTATEEEIKEAREYGVELIAPSPIPKFKKRDGTPDPDWLYHHKDYFPNLKELTNVRFVFGFGMITSEAAFEIERDVFKRAAFYLINLYDSDFITPVIANCVDGELENRRECLSKEGQDSSCVFSSEGSIFEDYEKIYCEYPNIKHSRLSPIVDENYFKIQSPKPVKNRGKFQILSLFQEHELASLTRDSAIMKAVNSVADSFHKSKKSPLKWKILGVPKLCESTLLERMNPHSKLNVVLGRMPSAEHLYKELGQSNLVLLHDFSVHYVNLTLAAMCAAVPIIIPDGSQSHELIEVHLPEYEESLVVDMSDTDKLQDRISKFLCSYNTTLKRANEIRSKIKNKVKPELENINDDFFRVVKDDAANQHKITLKKEKHSTLKRQVVQYVIEPIKRTQTGLQNISRKRKIQERNPGDMKVKVRVSEVVPEKGRTVEEVERGFYESDEVKEKTEEIRHALNGQHDEIEVRDVGHESISYTMSCQSLDALDSLRSEYEKGRLQDMMEDTLLSKKLLDRIGAFHLEIDTTIDYDEYFLCRTELIEKYGLPMPQTDTARIPLPEEAGTTESTFKRVNRARELLKEFESQGDQVTETQINMLDQLLREKHEKRRIEHRQFLQESDYWMFERQGKAELCGDPAMRSQFNRLPVDSAFRDMTDVHLLSDEEIQEKNEVLEAMVKELTISKGIKISQNRDRGQGRGILQSMVAEGDRVEERKLNTIFSEFVDVKSETRDLMTNHPELVMNAEKLLSYADDIVRESELPEKTKEVYLDVRLVEKGYPVKGSVLEVFKFGSMPGQFNGARGIYIKNNGQWVICDRGNHRVQAIDPIKLCCDLILRFHAFPKSFDPRNVTVDEDNDKYFMSDIGNGQVVAGSGQSKILNCFGRKERIDPRGICFSPDGFIFIGDRNGYVRKYTKSGEHIARTEKGQVSRPWDLIVNKKCIFVSDDDRKCVHVLNHQMQSIRDIGKGYLQWPMGLCFDRQQDGIYVCDYLANRVVHFNGEGEFLSYIGHGQLQEPYYIALCKDYPYRLVVTQHFNVQLLYI